MAWAREGTCFEKHKGNLNCRCCHTDRAGFSIGGGAAAPLHHILPCYLSIHQLKREASGRSIPFYEQNSKLGSKLILVHQE